MSTQSDSAPNIFQTSVYTKQGPNGLYDNREHQQKTGSIGQDNASTSNVPKGAIGLLDFNECLKEKMFSDDAIETRPEPGRQRLKEFFPTLEKYLAEARQVYADLADNRSS